ncbi:Hypothetical predicted protein [Lecanosticta acicola]|uniref:Uncharacterized protein n=1 Tax=Lecanosticta acicola TaxID=111012 RepID=A0AAI9EE78_9PEZI|nr:Hypothetical predicted protein [Lecanosticta acicola]
MPPLRPLLQQTRHFSTSPRPQASLLFALGALSNSRETQHFNKISRLDRTEHSPSLKLIKTSEVDPFKKSRQPRNASSLAGFSPEMERTVELEERVEELQGYMKATQKSITELKNALGWMLLGFGVASGLAVGMFWSNGGAEPVRDSGELGRKIAARAKAAIPLPSISESTRPNVRDVVTAEQAPVRLDPVMPAATTATASKEETFVPATPISKLGIPTEESKTSPCTQYQPQQRPPTSLWRNLFWREQ